MKNFKSVKECLDNGHKWEDCIKFNVDDNGKMKAKISNTCPLVMKNELKKKVFEGEAVTFWVEPEEEKEKGEKA